MAMFKLTNSEDIYLEKNKTGKETLLEGDNLKKITAIENESSYPLGGYSEQQVSESLGDFSQHEVSEILRVVKHLEKLSEDERDKFLKEETLPTVVSWTERGLNAVSSILTIASNPALIELLKGLRF